MRQKLWITFYDLILMLSCIVVNICNYIFSINDDSTNQHIDMELKCLDFTTYIQSMKMGKQQDEYNSTKMNMHYQL